MAPARVTARLLLARSRRPPPVTQSSATIYIDEIPGKDNGQDAPLKDQFWWASTSTDTTPVTSYSVNVATGGTLKVVSEADDPMKVTITGPGGYKRDADDRLWSKYVDVDHAPEHCRRLHDYQ